MMKARCRLERNPLALAGGDEVDHFFRWRNRPWRYAAGPNLCTRVCLRDSFDQRRDAALNRNLEIRSEEIRKPRPSAFNIVGGACLELDDIDHRVPFG